MLFSYDYTEKIKKIGGMNLDPKFFYARIGVVIILMNVIISTTLMGAARSINPDINIQLTTQMSGMVFTYVWAILLCVGGAIIRRTEEKQSYKHVFVQGVETGEDHDSYKKILGESDEENMKLPI